jgi:hypothetical protein
LTPLFVLTAGAAGLSALLGVSTPTPETIATGQDWTVSALGWGRPLLVAAAAAAGWRLYRLGRVPRWLWVALALAFSFWVLAGLNAIPGREAIASRYQYVSDVFILMIAAELLRGARLSRPLAILLPIALAAILISNLTLLHQGYANYRAVSDIERSDLGVLDITRGLVRPTFVVSQDTDPNLPFSLTDPGSYFAAEDEFGSPGFSARQIIGTSETARVSADHVLSGALGLRMVRALAVGTAAGPPPILKGPAQALLSKSGTCMTVMASRVDAPLLIAPKGGVLLQAASRSEVRVRLRRFAQRSLPVDLGTLRGGTTRRLAIPADRAAVPWRLSLQGAGPITVCGLGGARPAA